MRNRLDSDQASRDSWGPQGQGCCVRDRHGSQREASPTPLSSCWPVVAAPPHGMFGLPAALLPSTNGRFPRPSRLWFSGISSCKPTLLSGDTQRFVFFLRVAGPCSRKSFMSVSSGRAVSCPRVAGPCNHKPFKSTSPSRAVSCSRVVGPCNRKPSRSTSPSRNFSHPRVAGPCNHKPFRSTPPSRAASCLRVAGPCNRKPYRSTSPSRAVASQIALSRESPGPPGFRRLWLSRSRARGSPCSSCSARRDSCVRVSGPCALRPVSATAVPDRIPRTPRLNSPRRLWFSGSCSCKPALLSEETQRFVSRPPGGHYHDGSNGFKTKSSGKAAPLDFDTMSPGRYEPAEVSSSKLSSCYNLRRVCAVGPSSAACSTEPAHLHDTAGTFEARPASSPLPDPPKLLGFRAYGLSLAARIVGTRGTFGAFLASTLQLSQDTPPGPAQALFPLPAPFPGCFQHIPSAKSSRVRSRLAVRRVAHVAAMACNFLFAGMLPPPLQLLCRRPNRSQTKAIRYIVSLCRACGAVEPFAVSSAGRRSANLHSGLTGLSELLTWVGPGTDPYGPLFHGAAPGSSATTGPLDPTSSSPPPVPKDRSEDGPAKHQPPTSSPLRPCSLNAERLKKTGRGHWDPVPFLDGEPDLAIACLEPDVLLYGGSPPNNLLFLKEDYGDQVSPGDAVRMFNCYKNEVSDRQIGDRRSRNFRERALKGPSVGLPCGPALLGLALNPKTSTCRVCVCV